MVYFDVFFFMVIGYRKKILFVFNSNFKCLIELEISFENKIDGVVFFYYIELYFLCKMVDFWIKLFCYNFFL